MANLKVVSITDHETVRARAGLLNDMAVMASALADELMRIDLRLRAMRVELDQLQQKGGGAAPLSDETKKGN